jgi:hypothetical protein
MTDTAVTVTKSPTVPKRVVGRPFQPGQSGNPGGGLGRARQQLNIDTIAAMQEAFARGGKEAVNKVMKNSPAIFLKLLVLLVPRELQVEHKGGVKAMTDEQIEATIEAIQGMLAARADGANAKVIEGESTPMPPMPPMPAPPKLAKRKVKRAERGAQAGGRAEDVSDS